MIMHAYIPESGGEDISDVNCAFFLGFKTNP